MPLPAPLVDALHTQGLSVQLDAPLSRRTWWQVGGPADGFVKAGTTDEVQSVVRACAAHGVPLFVLGNGTNLLISDRGIRGLVLQLGKDLARAEALESDGPTVVEAGAGSKLVVLLKKATRMGWTGLEVFAGIPGTIGGAVRMNAGARLGETKDVLIEADVVLPDGSLRTLTLAELNMRYRSTDLPEGAVVVQARLQCTDGDVQQMQAHIEQHLDHRAQSQPLDMPSCGSTFRNPPGDHAGRLIEASGLKGHRVGDAQVSEKHANFVINLGQATAADVRRLVEHMQATVQSTFGVTLEREVHLVGDWSDWEAGDTA